MCKIFKQLLAVTFAIFSMLATVQAQNNVVYLHSEAGVKWKVKPESEVNGNVTSVDYNTGDWVNAVVPGTAFSSYVAAGLEKDPNFGDNIYKVDKAKYDCNFWYRTEVTIPLNYGQKDIWLNFDGVNRKADVYFNGVLLGKLDGFMQRGKFNITKLAKRNATNVLAVLVYLPQQPLANVGSPDYVSAAGWDWMPYVPGLDMGITDKVFLSNSDDLTISDPWIRSNLPTNARADLAISLDVKNASAESKEGVIKGLITPGNIEFSEKVTVNGNGISHIEMDKRTIAQLVINSPKLWWPNGYGDPNLYNCKLSLMVNNEVSDIKNIKFGIKKYTYDTVGSVLHLFVNGTRVFIKGGDWGMSEYMLRCRGEEYDLKVRLHKEMNYNMIRNWIGSTTDEEFYDACDKYGIMVWDEFWLNANPNLPADISVFNANAIEKIKRFRNHPSIAVWCADNEGWPEPPLSAWLKEDIATFDAGDRFYQPNSHAENLTGSGPWANFDARYYFSPYPMGIGGNRGWGLRTELGTAVFVNFESFKKFMPKEDWWPRNEMWNLHFFGQKAFNAGPDNYDKTITGEFGAPSGIEDYCRKAQFVNLETNKAMYEGWLDHMGEDASGIMIWMSQSAYPSMVWQTYDYYYDLTGAFWGAKSACEPLHIQWNPVTDAIKVINTSSENAKDLTALAEVYNMDGTIVDKYTVKEKADVPSNSAEEVFVMPFNKDNQNLANDKKVVASSTAYGTPEMLTDGKDDTRWSSESGDNEWVYVDLGEEEIINGVGLNWQEAYAQSFKIQVSNDAQHWHDEYSTTEGRGGTQKITFPEVSARYVRMLGIERATYWGYSLYSFNVFKGNVASPELSDVHFIKLRLTDKAGKLVSENLYWRGNKRKDFTALNSLPKVKLQVTYKTETIGGKEIVEAEIVNPSSSPAAAFGIRVQATRASSGEQILPAIMNDNYFTLMKGESKTIRIEFDESEIKNDRLLLSVDPYNNHISK